MTIDVIHASMNTTEKSNIFRFTRELYNQDKCASTYDTVG